MLEGSRALLAGWPWFAGAGRYRIDAYSEFMPPPRLGRRAYGAADPLLLDAGDPWGWTVTEYEEELELAPGLVHIASQLVGAMAHLAAGRSNHGISRAKLAGNPYWSEALARRAEAPSGERFVLLLPLALSRTQDDKGRVRWTLLGGSEQGPARAFWRGFFERPDREAPAEQGYSFLRRLLAGAFGLPEDALRDLRRAGLRFLPMGGVAGHPHWREEPLPSWVRALELDPGEPLERVRFLLTFRAFESLPPPIQRAHLDGELQLLPFPGSLLFWGAPPYQALEAELRFAAQIPLLHSIGRHEGPFGIRVPQSGWLHEPSAAHPSPDSEHGPLRDRFKRTHRWARVLRHEDELASTDREDKMAHVLFSAQPDDVRLYGKPMARNAQIWSHAFRRVLDGPAAGAVELAEAAGAVRAGGLFGYRFHYPPMRVGRHEVVWQRPLVAYLDRATGQAALLPEAPLGYLTAYDADAADLERPIELWPRLLRREPHLAACELPHLECANARKLLEVEPLLPRSLAQALLSAPHGTSVEPWLEALGRQGARPERARRLADVLRGRLAADPEPLPEALTYGRTATRAFEVRYWRTIAGLAHGSYLTKNNADCVLDPPTRARLRHRRRDLAGLGDHLLARHRRAISAAGMTRRAFAGELRFPWQTDFDYPWMGGWLGNREGREHERNLLVAIPGRDRSRAVIMADHYDTAYMEDRYERAQGGDGARLAAAGADDNHSATAALLLAAPIFLALARAGRLGCDVWLVHLTGEEFPADCLGARWLCQSLVEGDLRVDLPGGRARSLSDTRVAGVYVLDMIAHNRDRAAEADVFQIAPGACAGSNWLAGQSLLASRIWAAGTERWNRGPARRRAARGRRSARASRVPKLARHLALHASVRPPSDPHSALYNTDGQIFSDAGVPVVLLMENYDINRNGYHDSHDTMANIDLDFGAALAAIAIESVARAASAEAR